MPCLGSRGVAQSVFAVASLAARYQGLPPRFFLKPRLKLPTQARTITKKNASEK